MAQTPNVTSLGLNQWGPEDDIRTAQFNEDNRIIDDYISRKADKAGDRIALFLLNGFESQSAALPPQYRKFGNIASLRGTIRHSSGVTPLNIVMFNIPAEIRPTREVPVLISTSTTGGGGYARMVIKTNGDVVVDYTGNQTSLNVNFSITCMYDI